MLKHRELVRAALRDEATVAKLETKLQALQLEKARQTDPWELISSPTMLDHPIAPRKKRIILFGLLAGLLGGIGASLLVERRTGLVYSIEELQGYLPCPMLKQLPVLSPTAWHNAADLLAMVPLQIGGPLP